MESQRKELKQMGKGNKPNKAETITTDQVEQLWEKGELGNTIEMLTPCKTLYLFYITQAFGFSDSYESRQLR